MKKAFRGEAVALGEAVAFSVAALLAWSSMAQTAPRFHHPYLPDILQFEKSFSEATIDALKAAGYSTKREAEFDEKSAGVWGDSELIGVDPATRQLPGGHDHRHHFGKAAGY